MELCLVVLYLVEVVTLLVAYLFYHEHLVLETFYSRGCGLSGWLFKLLQTLGHVRVSDNLRLHRLEEVRIVLVFVFVAYLVSIDGVPYFILVII